MEPKNPNWDLYFEKIEYELTQNPFDLNSNGNYKYTQESQIYSYYPRSN